MLVPVVGVGSSWLLLGDPTSPVELAFGAAVVAGVLLGSTAGRSSRGHRGGAVTPAADTATVA
jgi:O-acetylserine/cysteine efflux transporter